MAEKLNFPFVEKEGKFFAPVVSTEPKYKVENGAVVTDGVKIVSGIKGVYAQVRISLPIENAANKSELFAISSEAVNSSF